MRKPNGKCITDEAANSPATNQQPNNNQSVCQQQQDIQRPTNLCANNNKTSSRDSKPSA
jgi:hypothetical protein